MSVALAASAVGAEKGISAAEAGATIATQFCGRVVGEPPTDVRRAADSIPGLLFSKAFTAEQIPEPWKTQFRGALAGAPYGLFHALSFDGVNPESGVVLGLLLRDATLCEVTTLGARDTAEKLEQQLKAAGSGWQPEPPLKDASVYRRKASNGRDVGMMYLSAKGITPINIHLMKPAPGSATAESIAEFADDAMRACSRVVLAGGPFESEFFPGYGAAKGGDGMVVWMRFKIPTAVVGIEKKGEATTCTIISGDPIDATAEVEAALVRAFMALPGAQGSKAEGWSIADAATGRKARMKLEPFRDRTSAILEPIP